MYFKPRFTSQAEKAMVMGRKHYFDPYILGSLSI